MKKIEGIITALSTPFLEGELDKVSFKKLLQSQVLQGIDGFVVNGTTAESPCLFQKEIEQILGWVKEESKNRILILGVGGNCTQKVVANTKWAKELKVDAVLAVVPYYNKPPQRGLVYHFRRLADSSELPVILYNVPARTGVGLSRESVVTLSAHPNIIGIKEASGDLELGKKIMEQTESDFIVLSGDDDSCFELCTLGARGVISVISHLLGKEMKTFFRKITQGENESSLKEYKEKYGGLLKNIYCEANPIGIKMALKLLGVFTSAELRSPLVALGEKETKQLQESMRGVGLLGQVQ